MESNIQHVSDAALMAAAYHLIEAGKKLLTIDQISDAEPRLVAELRKTDAIETAATFGGLLVVPELQASCLRIEALVHLAVTHCVGR
ncbi:MAG: hypothetical protein ACRD2B_16895, partial [Terriglobia bacterium]